MDHQPPAPPPDRPALPECLRRDAWWLATPALTAEVIAFPPGGRPRLRLVASRPGVGR